jgi:hypothetical protein
LNICFDAIKNVVDGTVHLAMLSVDNLIRLYEFLKNSRKPRRTRVVDQSQHANSAVQTLRFASRTTHDKNFLQLPRAAKALMNGGG